jgi:transcriptional regulator with XRE-family HTH domain
MAPERRYAISGRAQVDQFRPVTPRTVSARRREGALASPLAGQETALTLLRTQLGNTLRGHRLRQRRTLRDVSGSARVSLGYLSEVERGQKEASSELLASICDALDVELADLLAEVSLGLRVAGGGAVRPLSHSAEAPAVDTQPAVEQPAAAPQAAEPALALVGAGQPGHTSVRRGQAVSLAA